MGGENPTVDQVTVEEDGGTSPLEENLKSRSTWLRLIFMLVFCVLISLASLVLTASLQRKWVPSIAVAV